MSETCTVDPGFKYLSIYGREANNLTVLTAAEGQRHFTVSANAILKLTYIKLEGGRRLNPHNIPQSNEGSGGSILVGLGGSLHTFSCYFYDNQAVSGGAIIINDDAKIVKIIHLHRLGDHP